MLHALLKKLKERFPKHAILFKTLNGKTDKPILEKLHHLGGIPLVCRQIYMLDVKHDSYKSKRAYVQDKKLWQKRTKLEWEKVTLLKPSDKEKVLRFYHELYVKKYSKYNPSYTPAFLEAIVKSKLIELHVLVSKPLNEIKAIQGIYYQNNTLTTPFIGYDQEEPIKTGLYRFMSLQLINEAEKKEAILNMSSGAASFKMLRGGIPYFEYHVVFYKHLSILRRLIWKFLYIMSEYFAKPSMKKMKV